MCFKALSTEIVWMFLLHLPKKGILYVIAKEGNNKISNNLRDMAGLPVESFSGDAFFAEPGNNIVLTGAR